MTREAIFNTERAFVQSETTETGNKYVCILNDPFSGLDGISARLSVVLILRHLEVIHERVTVSDECVIFDPYRAGLRTIHRPLYPAFSTDSDPLNRYRGPVYRSANLPSS